MQRVHGNKRTWQAWRRPVPTACWSFSPPSWLAACRAFMESLYRHSQGALPELTKRKYPLTMNSEANTREFAGANSRISDWGKVSASRLQQIDGCHTIRIPDIFNNKFPRFSMVNSQDFQSGMIHGLYNAQKKAQWARMGDVAPTALGTAKIPG